MSEGWKKAEEIVENDAGGAALRSGEAWYECSPMLWQYRGWVNVKFLARDDGTVRSIGRADDDEIGPGFDANGSPV